MISLSRLKSFVLVYLPLHGSCFTPWSFFAVLSLFYHSFYIYTRCNTCSYLHLLKAITSFYHSTIGAFYTRFWLQRCETVENLVLQIQYVLSNLNLSWKKIYPDLWWILGSILLKNIYLIFVLIISSDVLQSGGEKTICSANDYVFNVWWIFFGERRTQLFQTQQLNRSIHPPAECCQDNDTANVIN